MSDEKHVLAANPSDCLMTVLRFVQFQMSGTELEAFGRHLHECLECQNLLDILTGMVPYKAELIAQLPRGDFD